MGIGKNVKNLLSKKKQLDKSFNQTNLIRFVLNKDEVESKDRAAFSRYLSEEHEFPIKHLIRTALFLKVDIKVLILEKEEVIPPTKKVYVLGVSSCGVPNESFFNEHHEEDADFAYFTGEQSHVYALKAFGDSMESYIQDGEVCIFECLKNNGIEDGEVVHYSYEYGSPNPNDNGIKVYKLRDDGSIYLKPLNGKYDNIEVVYPEFLKLSRLLEKSSKAKKF